MPPTHPAEAFETCPSCTQRTAARFLRPVGQRRLCLLCAQRADRTANDLRAQIEDRRLHGGTGWLWKHVGYVAYATVGGIVLRLIVLHLLHVP